MQTLVSLRHGCAVNGLSVRHVRLREMTGHDEQHMANIRGELPVFLQSAELLARLASFEGVPAEHHNDVLKKLSVGDRVLLILHIRKMAIGDRISCTLVCPACEGKMSQDLSTAALLEETGGKSNDGNNENDAESSFSSSCVVLNDYSIKLRPATLSDQQQLLMSLRQQKQQPTLLQTHAEALRSFARSCIVSCEPNLPDDALNEKLVKAIGEKLKEIDPLADIVLDVRCPECNHTFVTPFDLESFFLEELAMRSRQLDVEVHWLALNYHWSEDSILSLTAAKRRRYIQLINETISEAYSR